MLIISLPCFCNNNLTSICARVPICSLAIEFHVFCCISLKDYIEPVEPVAPQRSLSSQLEAGGEGDAKGPAKDPNECVAAFGALIDAAVDVAKKIQLRDRELAKMSNQVRTHAHTPVSPRPVRLVVGNVDTASFLPRSHLCVFGLFVALDHHLTTAEISVYPPCTPNETHFSQ